MIHVLKEVMDVVREIEVIIVVREEEVMKMVGEEKIIQIKKTIIPNVMKIDYH